MVNSLVDEYVLNSRIYRDVKADVKLQDDSRFLCYDFEAIIKATEEIDSDIYCPLQALQIDKGIMYSDAEVDDSTYMAELMVNLAKLCSGNFAQDTLCQYMFESNMRVCQMRVAESCKHFFDKVSDRSYVFEEVESYLAVMK